MKVEQKYRANEWLENIPMDWSKSKLKYVVYERNKKSMADSNLKYIGLENIESNTGKYIVPDSNELGNTKGTSMEFYEGDILFGKLRPYLAKCIIAGFHGKGTTELLILEVVKDKTINTYIKYLLLSNPFIDIVNSSTYGAKMPRANWEFIGNRYIPLPQFEIQKNISSFLNTKTSEIDSLIADKEKLIELLEEKRQAIITETVTKGLNPYVEMKDSGVDWIGKIPEHWNLKRIKHVTTHIGSGKTPKGGAEIYSSSGVIFLRSQNIHYDGLKLDDVAYISPEIDQGMKYTRVFPNDVLLNITGASIGRSCLVPTGFPQANVNQHVCIVRPFKKEIVPTMLAKVMSSQIVKHQILMSQNGSSREGLSFPQAKNILFPLSENKEEQTAISEYIDEQTKLINNIIKDINKQIKKLNEYRQSLIYEAVTGKIDVRDYN